MYGSKVKLRIFFVLLILVVLSLSVFLILKSLEDNVVYFKSPTEIKTLGEKVKAVKYSILYMKAIKALQEAMAKIETLETKVKALEDA